MNYDYDIVIIGGGAAGIAAAKMAREFGKKILIIQEKNNNNACVQCIGGRALAYSAEIAYMIKNSVHFGLHIENNNLAVDSVMDHVRTVMQQVCTLHMPESLLIENITFLVGMPSFIDRHTIRIHDKNFTFNYALIATGSYAFVPLIDGLDTVHYETYETFFSRVHLPKKLLIIGGGSTAVEIASACNRLGSSVVIIEKNARILMDEDQELVALLHHQLEQSGICIATHSVIQHVEQKDNTITVHYTDHEGIEKTHLGDVILIAAGMRPHYNGLNLENIGVRFHADGIVINAYLQTTVNNIFACGDVIGSYRVHHMNVYQAVTALYNICMPLYKKKIDTSVRVWATYSAPELAHIGLTEQEARQQYGETISVYTRSYTTLDRAHIEGDPFGMVKIICDRHDQLLGMHILGKAATEYIYALSVMQVFKKKFASLHHVLPLHPTYAEIIWHMSQKVHIQKIQRNWMLKIARKLFEF